MSAKQYEIDMSHGSILKKVIRFSIPLILSNVLQLLYNAADIIVVSRGNGSTAMAGVGATGALFAMITNLFIGMSVGVTVIVSRAFGAHDDESLHRSVHTSVCVGIICGLLAMIIGETFLPTLLRLMGTPEGAVFDGALLYMRIILGGVPFLVLYNFGAAILRGVGDTKRPLYILASTGIVNVLLNLLFVFKFRMGIEGVAIATITANTLSAACVYYFLLRSDTTYKLYIRKLHIYKEDLIELLRIGIPSGIQGSLFALSNTIIQSSVNSFGESAIVGCTAASNIDGFIYTAMNAVSQTTVTVVSQNYGAKNEKRIKKSVWTLILCITVLGVVLGGLVVIFSEPLLRIYIRDSPEAVKIGDIRNYIIAAPYFLCGIMEVMAGYLRGLGYSTMPMINSLVGACLFRIVWIFFILPLNRSLELLFLSWPVSWILVIILHLIGLAFIKKRAFEKMLCD